MTGTSMATPHVTGAAAIVLNRWGFVYLCGTHYGSNRAAAQCILLVPGP